MEDAKKFREQIRILERKLGLLNKASNGSFCCCKVTLSQCHALVEIGRAGMLSLNSLAKILGIDASTTSRAVDALVRKEYVKREIAEEDRRSIQIELTATGQKLYRDIENKMNADFLKCFAKIPEEERAGVLHSMDLILEALQE